MAGGFRYGRTRRAPHQPLAGHTGWVRAVAVGRAGGRDVIVSGSDDGTVRVWDAATGRPAVTRWPGTPGRCARWRSAGPAAAT